VTLPKPLEDPSAKLNSTEVVLQQWERVIDQMAQKYEMKRAQRERLKSWVGRRPKLKVEYDVKEVYVADLITRLKKADMMKSALHEAFVTEDGENVRSQWEEEVHRNQSPNPGTATRDWAQ
ncbi:MAG: hypothetical protein Q9159_006698, partial [Coniocarpon cinnabarinum]